MSSETNRQSKTTHAWFLPQGSRTSTKKTWSMRVLGWALKRFKWGSFKRRSSCKWRVRRYFARWIQTDNTRNGVKDNYFKQYSRGFNGLCEWFGKSYPRILPGLTKNMYRRGDLVLLRLNHKAKVLSPGTKIVAGTVAHQMVLKFNRRGTRIQGSFSKASSEYRQGQSNS